MLETMYSILLVVLIFVITFLVRYFSKKGELITEALKLISEAEKEFADLTKAGGIKFEWVVTELYKIVPVTLKKFITRKMLETLVQTTFDSLAVYAEIQLNKLLKSK